MPRLVIARLTGTGGTFGGNLNQLPRAERSLVLSRDHLTRIVAEHSNYSAISSGDAATLSAVDKSRRRAAYRGDPVIVSSFCPLRDKSARKIIEQLEWPDSSGPARSKGTTDAQSPTPLPRDAAARPFDDFY